MRCWRQIQAVQLICRSVKGFAFKGNLICARVDISPSY
jgi:hypothetical protein